MTTMNKNNQNASATAPSTPATPAVTPVVPAAPPVPIPTGFITSVARSMGTKGTKVDLQTAYAALVTGLLAYYQPGDVFALKTGPKTRDELVNLFKGFIAKAEETKASYNLWRADVQAERGVALEVRPYRDGVHDIVKAKFGKDGAQLRDFGFTPQQPAQTTVAVKATAIAKGKATRTARGTKGAVQKAAVQGNVTGVVITPVTATLSTEVAAGEKAPAPTAPVTAPTAAAGSAAPNKS